MQLSAKVCEFVFVGKTKQEAYIKGCKAVAKYIASNKYENISNKIVWMKSKEPTVKFILYTNIDANNEIRNFCKICKEIHTSFFINEEYNCARCNLKAYMRHSQQKISISKNFYKSRIK